MLAHAQIDFFMKSALPSLSYHRVDIVLVSNMYMEPFPTIQPAVNVGIPKQAVS